MTRTGHAATIGAGWLAVARLILAEGTASRYDSLPVREVSLVTLTVERPDPADEIIARHADQERLAWKTPGVAVSAGGRPWPGPGGRDIMVTSRTRASTCPADARAGESSRQLELNCNTGHKP
jgi:hypothetical protein